MTEALHSVSDLARILLALEKQYFGSDRKKIDFALVICAKMQVPLSKFAGPVGFTCLLSRALALASKKHPDLKALQFNSHGTLERSAVGGDSPQLAKANIADEAAMVLLTSLLGLLREFIGESLTLTLISNAWPNESFEKVNTYSEVES